MSPLSQADDALLERTTKHVFRRVDGNRDIRHLPVPLRTFAAIYAAQGVIGNGGFQYLFEADWPGCPPYSLFADAYREIGASEVAGWLDQAAALFPFPDPHLRRDDRVRYLRSHGEEGDSPMGLLSDQAIDAGNDVWTRLAAYVREHADAFPRRPWWWPFG